MKNNIIPPLVLTIICIVVSGLLVFAHNQTYVDTTGVMTDELKAGCEDVFGKGEYEMLLDKNADTKTPVTFDVDGVVSVITDSTKEKCLVEIEEDGYSKGGLHVLIGVNKDGAVEGISFIECGETPGLGTKVKEKSFLDTLVGFDTNTNPDDIDNVTSATYSSKGMKSACKKAVKLYSEHKEEITNA
ncbi:MAG: FMN-binding protein [Ruminococcus sp.]|nr:FMN-binding protein [Ruminococcus sp.]